MLQPIELLPTARAALRRSVNLGCELMTDAHGPRLETLVDLSARGARVVTDVPVERGSHVMIGFAPEGLGRRIETMARVAHVDRDVAMKPSIGLEFVELEDDARRALHARLRGVPPPLPAKKMKARSELVWVEMLVTWEEDLGDQVNVWEVSERMATIDDGEIVVETMAPFLTGGPGAYRWLH